MNSLDWSIRTATVNDFAGICAVLREVGLFVPSQISTRNRTWVAVCSSGEVGGVLEGSLDSDFSDRTRVPEGTILPHGYLSELAVRRTRRQAGLATALVRAYCEYAIDLGITFVVVSSAELEEGLFERTAFFDQIGLHSVGTGHYSYLLGAHPAEILERTNHKAKGI